MKNVNTLHRQCNVIKQKGRPMNGPPSIFSETIWVELQWRHWSANATIVVAVNVIDYF